MNQLGYDPGPCLTLRNPAAAGLERLRRSLMPGLLSAVERNRFHFPAFRIIEVGSTFEADAAQGVERRNVGLVMAQRAKKVEDALLAALKGAIEGWSLAQFGRTAVFGQAAACADHPWEHPHRTASIVVDDTVIGRISVIDMALRRRMDEHLVPWGIAWAEMQLDDAVNVTADTERLAPIPPFPWVELDFSLLVPRTTRFNDVVRRLTDFDHPLLRQIRFVDSYEGPSIGPDVRSLTFRMVLGHDQRTLVDDDIDGFRERLHQHAVECGYEIRR